MFDINIKQLVMAIAQIAEEKNLPEETVHSIIEQALGAAWRRDYGTKDQEPRVDLNSQTGEMVVTVEKTVVEDDDVMDEGLEIGLSDAKKIKSDAKLDDVVEIVDKPTTFGRVAAQTAKQVVLQKLREAERDVVMNEFEDKIGTVVVGTVQRVEPRFVRVEIGKASGILPQSEQIPGEYYGIGSRMKVFLKDVERGNRGPQLILSRGNEAFVEYLFRQEVPEMENGAVEIKGIARQAGQRTKIAVYSTVPGVDPVGTFVGGHGTRVQAVMNEIGEQEKIDIITYSDDPAAYIANALAPAEIESIDIDEENKKAIVHVDESQLSIAIGRGGNNVRLAGQLTGYDLDVVAAKRKEAEKPQQRPARKDIEGSLLDAVEQSSND